MTREEKQRWDKQQEGKADYEEGLAFLQQELNDDPDQPHRESIQESIVHARKILGIIKRALGEE